MRTPVKYISIVLCFMVLASFISCKKKKTEEPETKTNVFTFPAQPYSIIKTSFDYSNNNNVVTKDSSVLATFFDAPIGANASLNFVSAGNVSLNDSNLYYFSGIYSNSVALNISGNLKWTVAGSGTITPFTYSYTPSYPNYTGGSLLPDTCIKANGITITISGLSNFTGGVTVFLSQSSVYLNKYISTGNGSATFSASEIAACATNSPIYFQVMFSNMRQATLGGVLHQFESDVSYQKVSYLK